MSLQRNFASKKAGVTDGIISLEASSTKWPSARGCAGARVVELRSRPVGG
jgi:hypothetical protein